MRRLLIMALALGSPVFGQDSTFWGNPQHTGDYGDVSIKQLNKIRWQFHTGGQVLSSPAVSGSSLYVGSSDHFLYALDRQDGILKWKFKTGGRITSSPAVSEGVVYFGSFDAYFYAVDAATGALKWKFKTKG
jgi:outer membrane protein assembly factor BamB